MSRSRHRTVFVGFFALVSLMTIGYLSWQLFQRWDAPIPSPDQTEFRHVPDGFTVHTETQYELEKSDNRSQPSTYAVVDIPMPLDPAVTTLVQTYERRGWQQLPHNDDVVGKENHGCISFESKNSFIAIYDNEYTTDSDRDRVDWAKRTVVNPDRQLIMSLFPC